MGQRPTLLNFTDLSEGRQFIFENPLGYRKNGKPIYMVAGGSGEDDDDDDDASGVNTDGSTVPIGRYLKVQNRMKAADRRANDLQAKLTTAEAEAAKVPDLEKAVSTNEAAIKKLRIDNAFLTSSDISWQDPEVALQLVDLSKVTIDDNGVVQGLADALKDLAEKKPFLVKQEEEDKDKAKNGKGDEDDEDESEDEDLEDDETDDQDDAEDSTSGGAKGAQNGRQGGGVSGTSTGSGKRRRNTKGPSDEDLMRRYRI